ncbi:hypothetical protein N7447_004363 [Penicillium robsamsonii]|uniref:uncharacterized protein n=1 Tax=Penicillium robsamsonii TaxID=1792511 RepID=UPI002548F030|nr:uncharacterized protein N7447_004363 [Penicillium robsamsonii]KAJ5827600.1 hypothetical protein N7447_004363 [Penicillium robsamsonii]
MIEKSLSSSLEFKSYQEWNGDRPSQTLIFRNNGSSWWIKVVVDWSLPESILHLGYLKRRCLFQTFVEAVDFSQLQLLEDTVTMLTLSFTGQRDNSVTIRDRHRAIPNYFIGVAHQICCKITEDPRRVIYPTFDRDRYHPIFEASYLRDIKAIAPTISTVFFNQQKFAYKTIDRPIYEPGDTNHILDEIDALTQLRGQPNIAQIIGTVVSENPYKTYPSTDMPAVIIGFLLEYYPGGSLEEIIREATVQSGLLVQWALQIGRALESLHTRGRSHLDIKPSNIVFDDSRNAILIDISGTGGYMWEWLSPEMQMLIQQNGEIVPANTPFEARVATDSWAYGRLLSTIAEKCGTGRDENLQLVASGLTKTAIESRISLSDALAKLEQLVCRAK